MQILVLTESLSSRVRYIFTHILTEMLGLEVVFTQNIGDISTFNGPVIAYTHSQVSDTIHITPHTLLSLKGIEQQSFAFFTWHSLPAFFATCDNADIPFDVFAASFFMLTRYEEYLPHTPDLHDRFKVEDSIAFRKNFLEIPIVDLWVKELGKIIKEKYPRAELKENEFKFIPTVDIDNAYAYQHKGFLRATLGSINTLIHFRFGEFIRRIAVYMRFQSDPFNTYKKLFRILSLHPNSFWFILGGKYGEFDRSIPLQKKSISKLLKRIGRHFNVGIHPSYASGVSEELVKEELNILKQTAGIQIIASRQHFLRIKFPETFRVLSKLGIKIDFSLGYSNAVGFRAGTCFPFNFYDLNNESEIPLQLIPFQIMDRALLEGLKLDPNQAVAKSLEIAKKVKAVGGVFVIAWHNESLSGTNEWVYWDNVFKDIVEGVKSLNYLL